MLFPALLAGQEPKRHVLFMGTDLEVQRGDESLRVQAVSGSAFLVKKAEDAVVPLPMRSAHVKIERRLKLGGTPVRIEKLRGDRTYTPANDPRLQMERRSGAAGGAMAAADLAQAQVVELESAVQQAKSNPSGGGDYAAQLERMLMHAQDLQRVASQHASSDITNLGSQQQQLHSALGDGNFDAMEVEFEISAEQPVADAYVVIVSRYRARDMRPGTGRDWVSAKAIGEIGPKPRYLRIREGGFPRGFILEDFEVHVYRQGEELPSNVSPHRVDLTTDEAMQYVLIEHLTANKGRTVPAEPALGSLPPDFAARMAAGQHRGPLFVEVDESGRPGRVFHDEAAHREVADAHLVEVLNALRFKPALVDGRPAASIYRVQLPGPGL